MTDARPPDDDRRPFERWLSIVTEVRPGEGVTALLLTANVFLLLTAYYLIKPVREAFLLPFEGGAEYKSYLGGAIALALLFAVPAYAGYASRVPRNRLVVSVTLFFASNLVLFYGGSLAGVSLAMALGFYVWVGIFNMMVVAQFWAFANDLYDEEQGKRLFVLIGLGASTGAWAGSALGAAVAGMAGVELMLVVAAALLAVFAAITQVVHRRETAAPGTGAADGSRDPGRAAGDDARTPDRRGAFRMVFRWRYLTLLAVYSLVFTGVNTNGEYILSEVVSGHAKAAAAEGRLDPGMDVGDYIGQLYSWFFFGVNALGVVLQAFVVSRLVRFGGLRLALFTVPVVALLDAGAVAIAPLLAVIWVGKTAENAADYSIHNTVRNMLWLPTTREMKYQAKQAVDTFFVRMGDVTSALVVFVFAGTLGWGVRAFAALNVVLVVAWLVLAAAILREQGRLKAQLAARAAGGEAGGARASAGGAVSA